MQKKTNPPGTFSELGSSECRYEFFEQGLRSVHDEMDHAYLCSNVGIVLYSLQNLCKNA
jgi:hypothetical protein